MSVSRQLHETADRQIVELVERLESAGEAALTLGCPGRARLGSVAAVVAHTTENYLAIAAFIRDGTPPGHRFAHHSTYEATRHDLLAGLAVARAGLAKLGKLGDDQLDEVPPAGAIRFADGSRTLEQVLSSLLRHQRHQVDAVTAALSAGADASARQRSPRR